MSVVELILIGAGLSMDAFAVAVCKGLNMQRVNLWHALAIAVFFGGFQALMPLAGWGAGTLLSAIVEPVGHWIAFTVLAAVGVNMIRETLTGAEEQEVGSALQIAELFALALATSIDALAVGVGFAMVDVDIVSAAGIIGTTTFAISLAGVFIGHLAGSLWSKPASVAGGIVLVLLGVKILVEHL